MTLDLTAIARVICPADRLPPSVAAAPVTGWSVDSRTLRAGNLFFALRGERLDGHDHVPEALAAGAVAAVVERPITGEQELIVPDTLDALQQLAAHVRGEWGGTVVGVTGSAGKTTTKDVIAHLLAADMPVGRTVGNFNNHVGVPISILRLPDDCRVAVLEIGMNHAGEIRHLASIARPEIGVVTNVGYAHVEFFDSIEGVALAKRELIEALPSSGTAVLNADDQRVIRFAEIHLGRSITFGFSDRAGVRARDVEMGPERTRFCVDGTAFETCLPGRHGVLNLLAGIAVARVFGIPAARLADAAASFVPGRMRGERLEHNGIAVWNDTYNANPEAMRAMIDVLRATQANRRIAVLGEMLELGHASEALHRDLGRYLASSGIDFVLGVRGAARFLVEEAGGAAQFFEDPSAAGDRVRELARPGDAVLFKGSRGVQVEKALERFLS